MAVEYELKEVYFDYYCEKCKHYSKKEWDEPCNECLAVPANVHSHKPVNYEAKEETVR